jgi:hypothetical protein
MLAMKKPKQLWTGSTPIHSTISLKHYHAIETLLEIVQREYPQEVSEARKELKELREYFQFVDGSNSRSGGSPTA